MFDSINDLGTKLAATGYFIDPVMTQVVFLAAKLQKPLLLEGPAGSGKTRVLPFPWGTPRRRRRRLSLWLGFSFPFFHTNTAPQEAAMKTLTTISLALAVATAGAQTTKQSQIRHIETSLNHLTVLEFGESVTTLAVADPDSFEIERHDDKVFVKPLREGISTNLFIWTTSRELSYELDPAGQLAAMDVLVRTEPVPKQHVNAQASAEPTDTEIRKIASLVLTQAMMGVEGIARDPEKRAADRVEVDVEQVYRAKDRLYIRYSIVNQSRTPFRVTDPDVCAPFPSERPISLVSLRNHQINSQTFAAFKARKVSGIPVIQAESGARDLAPGENTTGVISIESSAGNPPQIYQLNFGADQSSPLKVEVVL